MAEAAPVQTPAEQSTRGRAIAAAVCLVLAAVLTVPASFAYWGQRTINDGQRYVETVGPLVDSPEVQTAIATRVTAAIQEQVDVEAILNQAFAGVTQDRPRLSAPGRADRGRGQRADPDAGAELRRLRRVPRPVARGQHPCAGSASSSCSKGEDSGAVQVQGGEVVLDLSSTSSTR